MEFIQNQVLKIISLFECVNKEIYDMISDINDLREETNNLIHDIKVDISTLEKKVDSLNNMNTEIT